MQAEERELLDIEAILNEERPAPVDDYMMFKQHLGDDTRLQLGLNSLSATDLENYAAAKWGFLKNIININTFFAAAPAKTTSSLVQTKTAEPVLTRSSLQKKTKQKLDSAEKAMQILTDMPG